MGRYDVSRQWHERAKKILPCNGAQTLSKGPDRNPKDYPIYIDRGQGSHVWDSDGAEYIDLMSALGPVILGYADKRVTDAVVDQVRKGVLFSLESPLVVEVAEMLTSLIPGAEAVRFTKTGSDAVGAAVRVARAHTGRPVVLVASNSYHGNQDWFQISQPLGRNGVPANLTANIGTFTYNDTDSLEAAFIHAPGPVAAVVIEPARDFIATPEFLQGARELSKKYGALLVLDEVVTAFRFPGHTATAQLFLEPDLICLGKAMANGFPLGAIVGPWRIMDTVNRCFISGTYHGELSALAAAKATLTILRDEPVVDYIWGQGKRLMEGFNAAMKKAGVPGQADGLPICHRYNFTGPQASELKMAFMSECAARGVLPGLITYLNYSHTKEDIKQTIKVFGEVASELAKVAVKS